jgi:hypothetical protein
MRIDALRRALAARPGQPVSFDELIATVRGDDKPANPKAALRNLVQRLRPPNRSSPSPPATGSCRASPVRGSCPPTCRTSSGARTKALAEETECHLWDRELREVLAQPPANGGSTSS